MNKTVSNIHLYAKTANKHEIVISRLRQARKAAEEEMAKIPNQELDEQISTLQSDHLIPVLRKSYHEMDFAEFHNWVNFFPNQFSKSSGDWKKYQLRNIHKRVIKRIIDIERVGCFTDLEIWTAKRPASDSLLIGVIGDHRFKIARWGECLIDFNDVLVKKAALKTHQVTFSELARPVQQFIVNQYRKNSGCHFYIWNIYMLWHCWKPAQNVVVCTDPEETGLSYAVCKKCGQVDKYLPFEVSPGHS